jgi:hypothetical protein
MADIKTAPRRKQRQWPYRAAPPTRYLVDAEAYRRKGGTIDTEALVKGFLGEDVQQGDLTRFYAFCLVFEQIIKEGIRGDLLELGTYKGNTATILAAMARRLGRTAYILDTFEGFDQRDIVGLDLDARAGTFSDTSLEAVRARVGDEAVQFVKGYFPETAKDLPAEAVYCLVHIDCDLYTPITNALEYFYPRMAPGGFIIIHDYSSPAWAGAERAVDEFFANKTECVIPMPDGAGSAMVRKNRVPASGENWLLRKRAALLTPQWVGAGNNGLLELLGEGWRSSAEWGVWGFGDRHELLLPVPANAGPVIALDADVHAFLAGSQTSQQIIIKASGQTIGEWSFTTANNRGVRPIRVPIPKTIAGPDRTSWLSITFHPTALGIPAELTPSAKETRPLGVALHRIRLAAPTA